VTVLLTDDAQLREMMCKELALLKANIDNPVLGAPESTLVSIASPHFLQDYRTFVHAGWEVQQTIFDEGLVSEIVLVQFHPRSVHSLYDDPSDEVAACKAYALRSPYPTFHLLREQDIMAGITSGIPEPETIPARNSKRLQKLGLHELQRLWAPFMA